MPPGRPKNAWMQIKRPGVIMLLIALLLLPSAWNTGENLLYIIMGGVLSMVILSGFLARANLTAIVLEREAPYAVHRGESFLVRVIIQNRKRVLPSISLSVEGALYTLGAGYVLRLPPSQAVRIDVEHCFPRRGVYPLPDYRISSSFPFGFSEHRRMYVQPGEIVVYPKVYAVHTAAIEQHTGGRIIPRMRTNDGDEYVSLREYIPGDDIRLIAWRVSARTGVWMVREMGFGNIRSILLLIDTSRGDTEDFEERFEGAMDAAASLAITLLHRQYTVGVCTASHSGVSLNKGTLQEKHILDFLARIESDSEIGVADLEDKIRQLKNEPVRIVCLSPNSDRWASLDTQGLVQLVHPSEISHA